MDHGPESDPGPQRADARLHAFVAACSQGRLAVATQAANTQHYEVPTMFFRRVLGRHLKYSSAFFDSGVTSLDEAEARMLALTAERAAARQWPAHP